MLGAQASLYGSLIRAILRLGGPFWTEHWAGSPYLRLSFPIMKMGITSLFLDFSFLSLTCAGLPSTCPGIRDMWWRTLEEEAQRRILSVHPIEMDTECARYLDKVWQQWRPLMVARKASALPQFKFRISEERVGVSELYWSTLNDHNFLLVKKKIWSSPVILICSKD